MNYILNSIEEIQKIYIPDIEYLNDDSKEHSIDLKVFETELDKLITIEENRFVLEIKEELDKGNNIAFEMRLNNDVDNLLASIKFLKSISEGKNDFEKILVEKFKISYINVIETLKKLYKPYVSENIFPMFKIDISNDYGINFINGSGVNFINGSGNEIHQDLWDKMSKGQLFELNHINLQSTENTKRTISEEETISINDILSEPIKKLKDCGFFEVLQTRHPEVEKQQSIIGTIFRIQLNETNIKFDTITVGTQYYNFCTKIGLIEHLEKTKFKSGLEIATLLNTFSTTNDETVNEITVKTFENNHTNRGNSKSNYYPFTNNCETKVNSILLKLNLF